jgi:SAM-dependent methyltransferase
MTEDRGQRTEKGSLPPVLDVCCSIRSMWFDKQDSRAICMDKRKETHWSKPDKGHPKGRFFVISPDVIGDFTDLQFSDESFFHVVFDPPHLKGVGDGIFKKCYGKLYEGWEKEIRQGFRECFRVLKPYGTLVFKWCSSDIPLSQVLALSPEPPLYGQRVAKNGATYWVVFIKPPSSG